MKPLPAFDTTRPRKHPLASMSGTSSQRRRPMSRLLRTALLTALAVVAPSSAPLSASDPLTPAERQWLEAHPIIRLAPTPDYEPTEFFDEQGVYRGITADIVAKIEERLGIEFQVVRNGRSSILFAKQKNPTTGRASSKYQTHPVAAIYQAAAVFYVGKSQKEGWDKTPVKTITEACGISRSTFYGWRDKYPYPEDDDVSEEQLGALLEWLRQAYKHAK